MITNPELLVVLDVWRADIDSEPLPPMVVLEATLILFGDQLDSAR